MHVLSATVLACLFVGSISVDIDTTMTSTLIPCKQNGTSYAFTCKLGGNVDDIDVTTGHTMKLQTTGNSFVDGTLYKSSKNSITIVVASGVTKSNQYRCWVKKDATTTSETTTALVPAGLKWCVEGAKSALVVTKQSENKFAFTCVLLGNDGIDVSQGHEMILTADSDNVDALEGVDDSMTRTSITRTAEAYTASKKYSCKVSKKDDAKKSSEASQDLIEAPAYSGAASGVVKSVALTTGCLMVTLLKLSY